jgi:hypothetical protein
MPGRASPSAPASRFTSVSLPGVPGFDKFFGFAHEDLRYLISEKFVSTFGTNPDPPYGITQ